MVLILGKTGYVSKRFQDFFNYKKINYRAISLKQNFHLLEEIVQKGKPDYVINAIGFTGNPSIDSCENYKEECLYVNTIIPEIVTEICKKYDIPLGYVSTGCIYQQYSEHSNYEFKETDVPNFSFKYKNCSWYSGTKAMGENSVLKTWDKSLIWRLRMPFNSVENDKNYVNKLLKYPKVWSSKNSISNLDEFVQTCYYSLVKKVPGGIYNITNPGGISAKTILEIAKTHGIKKDVYEYFENLEEFNATVKTPRSNCLLDSSKIMKEGFGLLPIEQSVDKCFKNWKSKKPSVFWD